MNDIEALDKIKQLLKEHREEDIIKYSNLVETLSYHLSDENRPLTIILIDSYLDKLEEKEKLTVKDIQTIRLLHSQIMDQINEIEDKGLKAYLNRVLEKLEGYLNSFYETYGYLPPYAWFEDEYRIRRVGDYDYSYPIDTYYKRRYPPKEQKRTSETLTGLDLTDATKDDICNFLKMPYKYEGHPDEEIDKVLQYTAYKLQKDLAELRKKRMEREAKLSKDEKEERFDKMIDTILEGLKSYKLR